MNNLPSDEECDNQYVGAPETKEGVKKRIRLYPEGLKLIFPREWINNNIYDLKEDEQLLHNLEQHKNMFAEPNVIQQNYNQGILIVEGSSADIIGNKISANFKSNIGLGGSRSGQTCIKQNLIEESKSEGIFVVEGEERLQIVNNWINKNNDGIVLLNSKGEIAKNHLNQNATTGITTTG